MYIVYIIPHDLQMLWVISVHFSNLRKTEFRVDPRRATTLARAHALIISAAAENTNQLSNYARNNIIIIITFLIF